MRLPERSGRLLPLEALRGMAAMLVVMHHFFLGYMPALLMFTPPSGLRGLLPDSGTPLFVFVNGKAMVIIFFVLSGYVLALKGLRPNPGRVLADAAIKRWFRFAPVVLLALLFSYSLFALHLYRYDDAGVLNGSLWLHNFGDQPQNYVPHFSAILYEALAGCFLSGESRFDPVLWTMQIEFFGSMIVFMLASLLPQARRGWLWLALALMAVLLYNEGQYFIPFLLGVLGAGFPLAQLRLNRIAAFLLVGIGMYFCGYYHPQGWYGWLSFATLPELKLRILLYTLGGFLLLLAFTTQNAVSRRFQGRASQVLGILSFPLYLLHAPILTSFCAWAFVVAGGGNAGLTAALLTFALVATPLVWGLAKFDVCWLKVLSRWHPAGKNTPA